MPVPQGKREPLFWQSLATTSVILSGRRRSTSMLTSMLPSMLTSMLLMVLSTPPKAAQNEKTCDAAITNVTGSNSVNVFLGLGISWMIASAHVNQIYCFSPRICSRTLIKYSEISVCSGGGTEQPITVLSERQPATSIYADGRSSDDVITF